MIVTRIESLSSSRVKVYLDEELAFVLYKGELRLYGIGEKKELPEEVWLDIYENVLKKRACLRCMNLLKQRSYTVHQLRRKLLDGGYLPELAEYAISYVESYGYVNDKRYAQEYIRTQSDKKSRRRIEEDLLRKGISREILTQVLEEAEQNQEGTDDLQLARKLLEKKQYHAAKADYKERQKLAAWLYRKGIGSSTIRIALDMEADE